MGKIEDIVIQIDLILRHLRLLLPHLLLLEEDLVALKKLQEEGLVGVVLVIREAVPVELLEVEVAVCYMVRLRKNVHFILIANEEYDVHGDMGMKIKQRIMLD